MAWYEIKTVHGFAEQIFLHGNFSFKLIADNGCNSSPPSANLSADVYGGLCKCDNEKSGHISLIT
jgi:hypothetical protein